MREYRITCTVSGKRRVYRQWGYNPSNARAILKEEIGYFSIVSTVEIV